MDFNTMGHEPNHNAPTHDKAPVIWCYLVISGVHLSTCFTLDSILKPAKFLSSVPDPIISGKILPLFLQNRKLPAA